MTPLPSPQPTWLLSASCCIKWSLHTSRIAALLHLFSYFAFAAEASSAAACCCASLCLCCQHLCLVWYKNNSTPSCLQLPASCFLLPACSYYFMHLHDQPPAVFWLVGWLIVGASSALLFGCNILNHPPWSLILITQLLYDVLISPLTSDWTLLGVVALFVDSRSGGDCWAAPSWFACCLLPHCALYPVPCALLCQPPNSSTENGWWPTPNDAVNGCQPTNNNHHPITIHLSLKMMRRMGANCQQPPKNQKQHDPTISTLLLVTGD